MDNTVAYDTPDKEVSLVDKVASLMASSDANSRAGGLAAVEALSKELSHSVEPFLCLLYTSPSPRDRTRSRMPSSA